MFLDPLMTNSKNAPKTARFCCSAPSLPPRHVKRAHRARLTCLGLLPPPLALLPPSEHQKRAQRGAFLAFPYVFTTRRDEPAPHGVGSSCLVNPPFEQPKLCPCGHSFGFPSIFEGRGQPRTSKRAVSGAFQCLTPIHHRKRARNSTFSLVNGFSNSLSPPPSLL